ncbi:MAG TPA: hypothetical protein VM841_00275 [Actinomycetota bacterium]|nr:hypothetical protein [Actinomycetota bacterium]
MSHFTCKDCTALAAELALGVAGGEERAHALSHIGSCPSCRAEVEEMSMAADAMLMLAPQVEPPIGFEARVMARVSKPRRRVSIKTMLAAAVIAAVASAATGMVVYAGGSHERHLATQYEKLVQALGGKTLRAAELRALDGTVVGKVYAYDGKPSWLFLVLQDREGSGQYEVQLEPVSGDAITLAGLTIKSGRASWATTASVQIDDLESVSILDSTGVPIYGADFKKQSGK